MTSSRSSERNGINLPVILISLFIINEYARPILFAKIKLVLIIEVFFLFFLIAQRGLARNTNIEGQRKVRGLWILLLAEMFFHIFFAKNNYWAFEIFKAILSYFLLFLMASCFVDTKKKANFLIMTFILTNVYCAVIGIIDGGLVLHNSFLEDENDFALAMNVALPITFYFSFCYNGIRRYLLIFCSFLMFLGGVYSLSRGGMVGVAVVLLLVWLKSDHKVLGFIILILGIVIFIGNMPHDYRSELFSIETQGYEKGTGRERIELWKVASKVFYAYPVFGVGQGNIPWRIQEFQGHDYWKRGIGGTAVHSIYFTLLPELGLVGCVIFALLVKALYSNCKDLAASRDPGEVLFAKGIIIAFVGFFVTGTFLSVLYYPHFWILATLTQVMWLNRNTVDVLPEL